MYFLFCLAQAKPTDKPGNRQKRWSLSLAGIKSQLVMQIAESGCRHLVLPDSNAVTGGVFRLNHQHQHHGASVSGLYQNTFRSEADTFLNMPPLRCVIVCDDAALASTGNRIQRDQQNCANQ